MIKIIVGNVTGRQRVDSTFAVVDVVIVDVTVDAIIVVVIVVVIAVVTVDAIIVVDVVVTRIGET